MPKTLPQRIVFTIVMATIMVYGMIVYNVALNTGGVTNAGILCGRKAGHRPGVHLYAPHGPPAVHYLCHLPDDRLHHVPSYEPCGYPAVQGAQLWHMGAYLGLQLPYGALLADVLLRPAQPVYLPRYFPQTAASGKPGTALKQIQHAARTNRQRAFFIVLHLLQNFLNKFPAFA